VLAEYTPGLLTPEQAESQLGRAAYTPLLSVKRERRRICAVSTRSSPHRRIGPSLRRKATRYPGEGAIEPVCPNDHGMGRYQYAAGTMRKHTYILQTLQAFCESNEDGQLTPMYVVHELFIRTTCLVGRPVELADSDILELLRP
jgi:hypothetical protein